MIQLTESARKNQRAKVKSSFFLKLLDGKKLPKIALHDSSK